MKMRLHCETRLVRSLAILLLATSCVPSPEPTPTGTPPPMLTPATDTTGVPAAPTLPPISDNRLPPTSYSIPTGLEPFPLDLVPIDSENIGRLAPFKQLSAEGLPASISAASLAFFAPNDYEVVAHLDDGQLIVWNMASGAVAFRDWLASGESYSGQHPALAASRSYHHYLATSESIIAETGPKTASGTVIRPPDESESPVLLSGASTWPGWSDTGVRVLSIAFSHDGDLLAASLADAQGGWVQIWDIHKQSESRLVQEIRFDEPASDLQFTPDGSALVCATGNGLVTIDPTDGRELQRETVDFPVLGLATGPSGDSFAFWGDHSAVLESPAHPSRFVISADETIRRVELSPDEKLAVVADGDLLRFWELSTGVERASFHGYSQFLDVRVLYNGRIVATVDDQSRVLLWGVRGGLALPGSMSRISATNAASLERAATLYVPGGYWTQFSPNSDWLGIGSGEGIYLVDLPGLQTRRLLPGSNRGVPLFSVSANARWLAWVEENNAVKVWDLEKDSLAEQIRVPGLHCCSQVLLSPQGDSLVTLGDWTVRLWDLRGSLVYTRKDVSKVYLSPDASRLAFEQGLDVSIWDRKSRKDVQLLTGFTTAAPVVATDFSPTWNTMYWVARVGMQFVDVASGTWGPEVPFSWGEFSPSGDRIAAVEAGWTNASVGQVHMIDVHSGDTLAVFDHDTNEFVRAVAFSPDGRLLATALGETIKIWDAQSGQELTTLPKASGAVHGLAFSPDRRILLSRSEGALTELWVVPAEASSSSEVINATTASSVAPVESLQLEEAATAAAFSPDDGNIAISTASGSIWFWDQASYQKTEIATGHGNWIYRLGFGPTGVASASKDGIVDFWEAPDVFRGYVSLPGEVSALAIFSDGKALATGGQDGVLRLWDLPSLQPGQTILAHSAWVWGLAASPNGDLLATASADHTVKLWAISAQANGDRGVSLAQTLTGHTATVWGVAFSPDVRTLASASWDNTVRLWDVTSGRQLAVLQGHTDWVYAVAFSPDGSVLASSSADGTIRLWDPATGTPLATLDGPGGRIWSVDFSKDGRSLVSASGSGEVTLWGVVP